MKPRFEDWNLIKAQALITGKVNLIDEKMRVEFRLWDILAGKEMMALAFTMYQQIGDELDILLPIRFMNVSLVKRDILIQELFMLQRMVLKLKESKNWQ